MSNRKNPRRPNDKFTGPTSRYYACKHQPRGLNGPIGPSRIIAKIAKHRRIKAIRNIRITIELF